MGQRCSAGACYGACTTFAIYIEDPNNAEALGGIMWFVEMAQWLAQHRQELGEELAALGS